MFKEQYCLHGYVAAQTTMVHNSSLDREGEQTCLVKQNTLSSSQHHNHFLSHALCDAKAVLEHRSVQSNS